MLIVDGHNLALAEDEARKMLLGGDPDGSRRRVLDLVEVVARSTNQQAMVVFDGAGGGEPVSHRARDRDGDVDWDGVYVVYFAGRVYLHC